MGLSSCFRCKIILATPYVGISTSLHWQSIFHLTPFVVSTDRMMGREAKKNVQSLSLKLSHKWHRPYSHVCGFLKARISAAIIRATICCT